MAKKSAAAFRREEGKRRVILEFGQWASKHVPPGEKATGNHGLLFYLDQGKHGWLPQGATWDDVHGWLLRAGKVTD